MPDENIETTPADDTPPAAPPRRRRAASRPAGPPSPPAQPAADTVSKAAEPAPDQESSAPIPAADDPVTTDAAATQPDGSPAPAAAPKRSRARKAKVVAEPAPAAPAAPEPAATGAEPTADDAAAAEASPPKRSRSRKKTAPPVDEAPAAPAAPVAQPAFDLDPEAEPKPAPKPEPASEPEPAPESESTPEPEPTPPPEPAPQPDPQPTPETKPARRKRATKKTTEPVAEAAPAADVAASLAELEQRTAGRRKAKAEAFGTAAEVNPDEILSQLAAAIGAREIIPTAEPVPGQDQDDAPAKVEDAESEDSEETAEQADDAETSDEPRRRRRRRGGRRRRRSGGADEADAEAGENDEAEESEQTDESAAEGGSRRRRRRRRRGEDVGDAEDDPSIEVVARVREPRRARSASDEVTGIEGSTRMEAKKQRRREGRAAGRRRSAILSEAEFLARRESVDRKMLIRQAEEYSQIAVMEDGILVEHYVDRASANSMIGNIYLGRVQNVLPSMEAAFVDIGRGRNAVLYAGEIDWASFGVTGQDKKVEKVFKSGQTVLVQVSKDPVGAKGARLTSHVSMPGRYIVYSPGGQLSGISRKLPENERKRLKNILDELIGPDASVIIRTAAEGAAEEELVRDVNRLKAQWEVIEKKVASGHAPTLLYGEPDLTLRIVRDLFTEDFGALVVDGDDTWETVEAYVSHVAPHLTDRLQRWDRAVNGDIFDAHRVHEQVAKALERKVFLPSGGSLIIDRTEAMTVIDVNTGRFTGTSGNLEATVTSNNLEAAEEIVRQLRLRDIGGIIVIDFIDMVLPSNRELLLRRLVECLGRDRTRHQVAEVTSLGLVQMTRKKIGTGLAEAFTVPCETCKGRGYHTHDVPVASQAPADGGERESKRGSRGGQGQQSRQRSARVRKSAPELAAVVAATLAHPVTPELAQTERRDVANDSGEEAEEQPSSVPVAVVEAVPAAAVAPVELATLPEIVPAPQGSPSSPDPAQTAADPVAEAAPAEG